MDHALDNDNNHGRYVISGRTGLPFLLPLKREMKEAAGDINFSNRKEVTKFKLFRAICNGPYLSQLRAVMKSVTDKTGETPELQGMEEKIRSTMEENVLFGKRLSPNKWWKNFFYSTSNQQPKFSSRTSSSQ